MTQQELNNVKVQLRKATGRKRITQDMVDAFLGDEKPHSPTAIKISHDLSTIELDTIKKSLVHGLVHTVNNETVSDQEFMHIVDTLKKIIKLSH